MRIALKDISESYKKFPVALFFAWGDTKARYRRSVIGPFWLVLGTAIGIAGLGYLWSAILKIDYADFFPSLAAGLIIWQLISGCITEAASVFTRNAGLIRNIPLPLGFFAIQLLFKHLVNFSHNLIVLVVILLIFPAAKLGWVHLQVIPGFLVLLGNLLWILLLIGMIGARYRDIEPLIGAFMPMLFFLTPVIYKPNHLGAIEGITWFNPLTYLITLVRDPVLGAPVPDFVWVSTILALVLGWTGTLFIMAKKYNRLAFWV